MKTLEKERITMDIKHHIREAQRKIINNLITCELLIADLYSEFGRTNQEMSEFWQDLALEEKEHAAQLTSVVHLQGKGLIFQDIGRFDTVAMAPLMDMVKKELESARLTPPSPIHALSVALDVETSLIDSHFYEIVKADSPEYQAIARELGADTKQHVEKVRAKFIACHHKDSRKK
ncbi:MAG: hypothetical protein WCI03_00660 [bacterium]